MKCYLAQKTARQMVRGKGKGKRGTELEGLEKKNYHLAKDAIKEELKTLR